MSDENKEGLPNLEGETTTSKASPNPTQTGGMFGITSETKDSNNVPIPVARKLEKSHAHFPNGWQFPVAKLVNVVSNPELEKKDGSTVAVLQFIFRDNKGRQYIHTEWEQETTDKHFARKTEGMNSRIKHIHTNCFGQWEKDFALGTQAKSFVEFFNIVESDFNNRKKEDGNKIYNIHSFYIKLIYYKANLGFPLSPNFIERINLQDPVCKILSIHPIHDKLEPSKTDVSNIPGMSGSTPTGDLPDFDDAYS